MATLATATPVPFGYPKGFDNTQRNQIVRGTFTFTQGQYPPGGFTLSWGSLEGVQSIPPAQLYQSSTGSIIPIDVDVKSVAYPPTGIVWVWDNVNNRLHAMIAANSASGASGPLEEFGGAALPGWMLNDIVEFTAVFSR